MSARFRGAFLNQFGSCPGSELNPVGHRVLACAACTSATNNRILHGRRDTWLLARNAVVVELCICRGVLEDRDGDQPSEYGQLMAPSVPCGRWGGSPVRSGTDGGVG